MDARANLIISLADRVSGPLRRITDRMQVTVETTRRLSQAGDRLGRAGRQFAAVGQVAGAGLGLVAGAGWLFHRTFVATASQFERFLAILETTEGSAAKAQEALDWASDFAATTPYALAEVTDAFVKLRAYGMEPTQGLLRTLGDTAAGMGKPLMQAVEAIADAQTGEYERLKEFGIRAAVDGQRVAFRYTDRAGKEQIAQTDARNREAISSTLGAIWNDRYGGAMQRLSTTWSGMLSNLGDQWTRFQQKVMAAGVFAWMQSRLQRLLDQVDQLAASGRLDQLAQQMATRVIATFETAERVARALWDVMRGAGQAAAWLADQLGGYERLGKVLAGLVLAAPFLTLAAAIGNVLTAISLLTLAVPGLLAALAPLAPFLVGAAALGALGYGGYKVYQQIKNGPLLRTQDPGLGDRLPDASRLGPGVATIRQDPGLGDRLPDASRLGPEVATIRPPRSGGTGQPNPATELRGKIEIKLSQDGIARVRQMQTNQPDVYLDVIGGALPGPS